MTDCRGTTGTGVVRSLTGALALITMLGSASMADAQTVAVLFNGFSARSGGSGSTGMDQLAERLTDAFGNDPNQPFSASVFEHDEGEEAFELIDGFGERSCLILMGHSMGSSAAMQLARRMVDERPVALLVQLDSAGYLDGPLPESVTKGVNYFQTATGRTEVQGRTWVTGSENYRVEAMYGVSDDRVTHTTIDDARFAFRPREYRAFFRGQRDLHARIEELVEEACLQ